MPSNDKYPITNRPEALGDIPDVLERSLNMMLARADDTEVKTKRHKPHVPIVTTRDLLTEEMLAERWVCSVSRLQRWRSMGVGLPYLKIGGKVLYRLKDIEAHEELCLVRV